MVQETRVRELNNARIKDGAYVVYWMQASQRTHYNYALEYAAATANDLKQPLVVVFGLMDDYPEANVRHYAFMLEGLRDVGLALARRQILFVVRRASPPDAAITMAARASLLVCDRGYLRHQKAWRNDVGNRAKVKAVEVESDVVVPVDVATTRQEYAARTIRPKLHAHWPAYIQHLAERNIQYSSLGLGIKSDIDVSDPAVALSKLKVDRTVNESQRFTGGQTAATNRLATFIDTLLDGYASGRNEPAAGHSSRLSAYLHFGQISPVEMVLAARERSGENNEDVLAFVEELAVRRELSMNFANFSPQYDSYDGLPAWARKTLDQHASDSRPHIYSIEELEQSRTHDVYWNAAMTEMTRTGFMQNYMRMYWGKKVIEWTRSPREAFTILLHLNNKYFLCGRDPVSFASVGWIFGLHDRPWGPERSIFGLVRYMNAAGLERKFDMEAYVRKVSSL